MKAFYPYRIISLLGMTIFALLLVDTANAQLEGAVRVANFENRLSWEKEQYTASTSSSFDSYANNLTSICDEAGTLLYQSNGKRLYNSTLQSIALPVQEDKTNECLLLSLEEQYALVIIDDDFTKENYIYQNDFVVNAKLRIYYLSKNASDIENCITDSLIIDAPLGPFVEAIKHANGKDYWLCFFQMNSSMDSTVIRDCRNIQSFRMAKLTSDGSFSFANEFPAYEKDTIGSPRPSAINKRFKYSQFYSISEAKFSLDGKYFIFSNGWATDVYGFSTQSGTISYSYSFNTPKDVHNPLSKETMTSQYFVDSLNYEYKLNGGSSIGIKHNIFELSKENTIIYLRTLSSTKRVDTVNKVLIDKGTYLNDCTSWHKYYDPISTLSYHRIGADASETSFSLGMPFDYNEKCFERRWDSYGFYDRNRNLNHRGVGGAFYDMQLMPDGLIYLINFDDEGGLSYITTNEDGAELNRVRDGSPAGFQGDEFSKVVTDYKKPAIKILAMEDTIQCGEQGVWLSYRGLGYTDAEWATGSTADSIYVVESGWYSITANSWMGTLTDSIYIEKITIAYIPHADTVLCYGEELDVKISGDFDSYLLYNEQEEEVAAVSQAGTYTIHYTQGACTVPDSFEVVTHPAIQIEITQIDTGCIAKGDFIGFDVSGQQELSYTWNGLASVPPIYASLTDNILEVTDAFGCSSFYNVQTFEDCSSVIFIPNAITPNGDGLNDVFKPIIDGAAEYTVRIYTRWGEQIAQFNETSPGWNAKDVPMGAYLVTIAILDAAQKAHYFKQTVTVVR